MDKDGDVIDIESDEDLVLAFQIMDKPLKITIKSGPCGDGAPVAAVATVSKQSPATHTQFPEQPAQSKLPAYTQPLAVPQSVISDDPPPRNSHRRKMTLERKEDAIGGGEGATRLSSLS